MAVYRGVTIGSVKRVMVQYNQATNDYAMPVIVELEEKLLAAKPTGDPRAYDHYLKGRAYARRMTRSDLDLAMQMFEHAILLDPGFALAHAGIANACGVVYEWHEKDERWLDRGRASCERALALDPSLPEALVGRARILYAQKRYDEALPLARQAAATESPDRQAGIYLLIANLYVALGKPQDGIADLSGFLGRRGSESDLHSALGILRRAAGDAAGAER